ncbi:MAG: hypothetical protein AAF289_04565 [Cyanobacteria bacterium P01_A01_bin.135]
MSQPSLPSRLQRLPFQRWRFQRALPAAALTALAILLPACEGGVRGLFSRRTAAPQSDLSDDEIQQYMGQTLRASGVIQEMVGSTAFLMEERSIFTDKEVLVINAAKTPVALPDEEDINLQVSGQLQLLDVEQVQQTYNTTLDPQLANYEGIPVIIADTITVDEFGIPQ